MIYLDTSYIIKCYVNEPGTPEVLELVQGHLGRAASLHGRAEFWAGIQRHVREGQLSPAQAREVWRQFEADEDEELWRWLPVDQDVVHRSCKVIEELGPAIFLRSSDALHLASAAENGFAEIYSNDRRLLDAAPYFRLKGINVII